MLEYHGSVQRLKDLAAGDVPCRSTCSPGSSRRSRRISGGAALGTGAGRLAASDRAPAPAQFVSIATMVLDDSEAAVRPKQRPGRGRGQGSYRGRTPGRRRRDGRGFSGRTTDAFYLTEPIVDRRTLLFAECRGKNSCPTRKSWRVPRV